MLLDEDPATLIHECTANFRIASDRDALSRISHSLNTLNASRTSRLSSAQTTLKRLNRRLHTLQQQHDLEVASHNPSEHAQEILRLDGMKFKVAKEASDAEIEGERLEGEVRRLGNVKEGLDRESEDGASVDDDGGDRDVLKLKLYRSLGIDVEPDSNGQYTRAVIRDLQKGTANVLELDAQRPLPSYTHTLWQTM